MCGYFLSISNKDIYQNKWNKAFGSIIHRGPDNSCVKNLSINKYKLKFGFHRLAIVDSKEKKSNQPFETKKSILIFNGEIYNYKNLREKLKKLNVKFKTKSDTEVLVRYLENYGIKKTQKDLEGMWSFVWYLKKEKLIFLSRDRYGEKPLYYYLNKNFFLASSEIKPLLIINDEEKFSINLETSSNYFNHGLIDYDKKTLFNSIFQIPPSSFTCIDLNQKKINLEIKKYYLNKNHQNHFSFIKNSNLLMSKLKNSFLSRLSDEVKNGLLISGGIDSSVLLSLSEINKKRTLDYFYSPSSEKDSLDNKSVSYLQKKFKLKVNKINIPKNSKKIFDYFNKLTWFNDYPLISLSNISQYLIGCAAKKQRIKVLISGQGADEQFYGYLKYYSFYLINLLNSQKYIIFFINVLNLIKSNFFSQIKYKNIFRYILKPSKSNLLVNNKPSLPKNFRNFKNLKQRSFLDLTQFSAPTLCHTEDRMYMASGIETRFPYLNKDFISLTLSMPNSFKLKNGYTKFILRKSFLKFLPKKILFRKHKEGFDIGQEKFLILNNKYIKKNILNQKAIIISKKIVSKNILKYFDDYCNSSKLSRKFYNSSLIFRIISFEIWLKVFGKYLK